MGDDHIVWPDDSRLYPSLFNDSVCACSNPLYRPRVDYRFRSDLGHNPSQIGIHLEPALWVLQQAHHDLKGHDSPPEMGRRAKRAGLRQAAHLNAGQTGHRLAQDLRSL